jgi:predicted kinase
VALLVVFAGLPGSGKSVLGRGTATALGATYLRIDSIESAIAVTLTPFSGNRSATWWPSGSRPTS